MVRTRGKVWLSSVLTCWRLACSALSWRQAQAFKPTRLATHNPARPQRVMRHTGVRANRCHPDVQRRAMRPPLESARSNCASSQALRLLASSASSTSWIAAGRANTCSASASTAGPASKGRASNSGVPCPGKTATAVSGTHKDPAPSTCVIQASSLVPVTTSLRCDGSRAGSNSGTTRVAGRCANSKNCKAARSQALSQTATTVMPSGPRRGAAANARLAGSSSRRSSSAPSSAARTRLADSGGNLISCHDNKRAGTTKIRASERGNRASGAMPWLSGSGPSPAST